MNLSENSVSYYDENKIYKIFSDSEDFPGLIKLYLSKQVPNKDVLDLGCGNGKYIKPLKELAKSIVGIDLSEKQLELAQKDNPEATLICSDASQMPFENDSFDIVYSCWMFGTILDLDKRTKAMNEAKRILRKNGRIILVENNEGGEFERVRGRYPDCTRTKDYNDWILEQGFHSIVEAQTYFQFEDENQSNYIFKKIWGENFQGVLKRIVKHNIVIFEYEKL